MQRQSSSPNRNVDNSLPWFTFSIKPSFSWGARLRTRKMQQQNTSSKGKQRFSGLIIRTRIIMNPFACVFIMGYHQSVDLGVLYYFSTKLKGNAKIFRKDRRVSNIVFNYCTLKLGINYRRSTLIKVLSLYLNSIHWFLPFFLQRFLSSVIWNDLRFQVFWYCCSSLGSQYVHIRITLLICSMIYYSLW